MIHLHVVILESKGKIEVRISREITKTETQKEIQTASSIVHFIESPTPLILPEEPKQDEDDWWKNEGGIPPFRRN